VYDGRTWEKSDRTEITKPWGHFTVGSRVILSHDNKPAKKTPPTTLIKYSDDNGHTWHVTDRVKTGHR
jgi:Neuraminidase (sialidase)